MQWDDVVKKAAYAKKKGAWHVDMVNILWIKRKNHLHFAMQMGKVSKWRDSNPRPFGPEEPLDRAIALIIFHFGFKLRDFVIF